MACGTQLAVAGPMTIQTLYSNLGSPVSFEASSGVTVSSGGTDLSTAFSFMVPNTGFNYQVTNIDFAAYLFNGTNEISATLYTDNGSGPGTEIYTTGPILGQLGSTAVLLLENVTNGPILDQGQTYWLSLDAPTDATVGWSYNDSGAISAPATFDSVNGWTVQGTTRSQGAFEIDGVIASPEPVSTALVCSGILALVGLRRKSKATF